MVRVALLAIIAASLVFGVLASEDESERYSDKYDYLNVDEVLANERLRNQYLKCFMESGPCTTPDAIFMKERFPEAVVTKCRKCTERQREAFDKIAVWFDENDPVSWEEVIRKAIADFQRKSAAAAKKAEAKA